MLVMIMVTLHLLKDTRIIAVVTLDSDRLLINQFGLQKMIKKSYTKFESNKCDLARIYKLIHFYCQ